MVLLSTDPEVRLMKEHLYHLMIRTGQAANTEMICKASI